MFINPETILSKLSYYELVRLFMVFQSKNILNELAKRKPELWKPDNKIDEFNEKGK